MVAAYQAADTLSLKLGYRNVKKVADARTRRTWRPDHVRAACEVRAMPAHRPVFPIARLTKLKPGISTAFATNHPH
jgi:hypothetical protein